MRKILCCFMFLLICSIIYAQDVSYIGKIEYTKESKTASGQFQERNGFSNTTYFNASSYIYLTGHTMDYAKDIEKRMKRLPGEIAEDSFEVARLKAQLVKQMESKGKGMFDLTTSINYSSKIQIQTRAESDQKFCVVDTIGTYNFELLEDTMNLEGLSCQKARVFFANKFYTVWFAPSIPFAAGPFLLHGLPGIIVLATSEDEKVRYSMKSITYPLETPFVINSCDGGKPISGREYRIMDAKRMEDMKARRALTKKSDGIQ